MIHRGTMDKSCCQLPFIAAHSHPLLLVSLGLGVIHRGNVGKSRTIMAPYLPSAPGGSTPSAYSGA